MAARFWVLDTGTWDASDTTHWSTSSGGVGGASVPGSGDTVTFDANSCLLNGTVTVNTNFSVTSITMGAFTGTLDFSANNNSPTMQTFDCAGTGVRTLNMGSGTWTMTGNNATIWTIHTTTNLTFNPGTATLSLTYSGSTGFRNVRSGDSSSFAVPPITVSAGTDAFRTNGGAASFHCKTINLTGFTGQWDLNNSFNSQNFYGDFTLGTGMTFTNSGGGKTMSFKATTTQSITTNAVDIKANVTIDGVGNVVTLADNLDCTNSASSSTLTLTNGTLNANNKNVTCGAFSSSNSNTRTITMGSGTWTLTGTGTVWTTSTTTNLTLTAGTSTIAITDTSASTKTFTGGGKTFNALSITGTGSGAVIFSSSDTWANLPQVTGGTKTLTFNASTTTTFTGGTSFGNGTNVITINSSSSTNHTLTKASGSPIVADYLSISDSTATGVSWYAGKNSTDGGGGNTGWIFGAPSGGNLSMMGI